MIEKIVLDYLNEELYVNCYMEVPANAETSFVVIEKTSGDRNNLVDSAMIALQSYGSTMLEAAELNQAVKAAMDELPNRSSYVFGAHLNSDYNFTDTTEKRYRYQAVYDINYQED